MSLKDNKDLLKYNAAIFTYPFPMSRFMNITLIDCHVFDFVDSSTTLTIVFIGIDSELYIRNATFINAQNYFAQAGIRGFKLITFEDIVFKDLDNYNHALFSVVVTYNYVFKNVLIENYNSTTAPAVDFLKFEVAPYANLSFHGLVIRNCNLASQSFAATAGKFSEIIYEDVLIENVLVSPGSKINNLRDIEMFQARNVTIQNVRSTLSTDTDSSIFFVNSLSIGNDKTYSVSDIDYKNSSLTFVKYAGLAETPIGTKVFTFEHMKFSECQFVAPTELITTDGLVYDLDIVLEFDNLTFVDIKVAAKAFLMKLGHQLPNNLTISNSNFSDISLCNIGMTSSSLQRTDLLTHIHFEN